MSLYSEKNTWWFSNGIERQRIAMKKEYVNDKTCIEGKKAEMKRENGRRGVW